MSDDLLNFTRPHGQSEQGECGGILLLASRVAGYGFQSGCKFRERCLGIGSISFG